MEMLETLWRIAQNHGPWMAAGAAAALLLARLALSKFLGKKEEAAATRKDIEQLLDQLEQTRRELGSIKTQLARVDWLAQQQWIHGRCVKRSPNPQPQPAARPVE